MDKLKKKPGALKRHARLMVQTGFTVLTNANLKGFADGTIYKGATKRICVPGLNCYSCPGALGSCPIGSLQAVTGSWDRIVAFYVAGVIIVMGAALGRFICGWLCPFGLVQDLLHKIPIFDKRLKTLPGEKHLRRIKYVVLIVFVLLLPVLVTDIIGQGLPWYCKYICPSGTLFAGIPLTIANEGIRSAAGMLFVWKLVVLVAVIVGSIAIYRPFCRYICPLGAIYGLFNPVALYGYSVDESKCTRCGACTRSCGFAIEAYKTPNSRDCIRCGNCKAACPHGAISSGFLINKNKREAAKGGYDI